MGDFLVLCSCPGCSKPPLAGALSASASRAIARFEDAQRQRPLETVRRRQRKSGIVAAVPCGLWCKRRRVACRAPGTVQTAIHYKRHHCDLFSADGRDRGIAYCGQLPRCALRARQIRGRPCPEAAVRATALLDEPHTRCPPGSCMTAWRRRHVPSTRVSTTIGPVGSRLPFAWNVADAPRLPLVFRCLGPGGADLDRTEQPARPRPADIVSAALSPRATSCVAIDPSRPCFLGQVSARQRTVPLIEILRLDVPGRPPAPT